MESDNQNAKSQLSAVRKIRKTNRYQPLDDFAVIGTPPVGGEGPLYSNLVGGQSMARADSMYDRINRELSATEKPSVTSGIQKTSLSDTICASLSVGLSGISLKPTQTQSEAPAEHNFCIPSTDENLPHKLNISDITQPRSRKISHFDSKHVDQQALLEAFNQLKALKEEDSPAITAPILSVAETLPSAALRQRKISAPSALGPYGILDSSNKSSMANFFFNGGLTSFRNKMSTNSTVSEIEENSLVPAINTDQKVALTGSIANPDSKSAAFTTAPPISPAIVTKKVLKRRPKKTALREMNLWAPQSM